MAGTDSPSMSPLTATMNPASPSETLPPAITELSVAGFKSIRGEIKLPVRPLTVLAGVNSSGKTSLLQPLLLLKQTLESPYDPGPLLLNGPHVAFQNVRELMPSCWHDRGESEMSFSVRAAAHNVSAFFRLVPGASPGVELLYKGELDRLIGRIKTHGLVPVNELNPRRNRFSWEPPLSKGQLAMLAAMEAVSTAAAQAGEDVAEAASGAAAAAEAAVRSGIQGWNLLLSLHLPGLRGTPQRSYPLTGTGPIFAGPFPPYTASILASWQRERSPALDVIRREMAALKLTSTVEAVNVSDAQVALRVGRMPGGQGGSGLVDISDVGVGVSQVLPVVVALYAAVPGALVYIEQPELHLHPRAQVALAGVLVRALKRGIRLVIETHSSLLLTGIQTEVAEGRLSPDDVNLSWVERDEEGWTRVQRAELQDDGTFGDWPVDFDDVQLSAGRRFLDAVDRKHGGT